MRKEGADDEMHSRISVESSHQNKEMLSEYKNNKKPQ